MSDQSEHFSPSPNPSERPAGLKTSAVTIKPPSPETLWAELVVAFNYLTRVNFKLHDAPKPRLVRRAMVWFPLVGALIGLWGASIDWLMSEFGLPGVITATFAVIGMLWMTRALHEEQLATLVNRYGAAADSEQQIGWLREERSVQYGTLGVILVIIMKIGAIANLSSNDLVFQSLVVASCWSRAMMVVAAAWLRPVSGDPVADYFQQPPALRVILAVALGLIVSYGALGSYATLVLGTGTGAGLIVALVGSHHVRGYNGPLLGTIKQVVELAILGTILAIQ